MGSSGAPRISFKTLAFCSPCFYTLDIMLNPNPDLLLSAIEGSVNDLLGEIYRVHGLRLVKTEGTGIPQDLHARDMWNWIDSAGRGIRGLSNNNDWSDMDMKLAALRALNFDLERGMLGVREHE
jgi:hypothetical protein